VLWGLVVPNKRWVTWPGLCEDSKEFPFGQAVGRQRALLARLSVSLYLGLYQPLLPRVRLPIQHPVVSSTVSLCALSALHGYARICERHRTKPVMTAAPGVRRAGTPFLRSHTQWFFSTQIHVHGRGTCTNPNPQPAVRLSHSALCRGMTVRGWSAWEQDLQPYC